MKSKKQKRIEALRRMEYRIKLPVPLNQDRRQKRNKRTAEETTREMNNLTLLIGRDAGA